MHSSAMARLIVEQAVNQFQLEFTQHIRQAMIDAVMPQINAIAVDVAKLVGASAQLEFNALDGRWHLHQSIKINGVSQCADTLKTSSPQPSTAKS